MNTLFETEIEKAYAPLTRSNEIECIIRAQMGSNTAQNELVNSQLKSLKNLAIKMHNRNLNCDVSELVAIGVNGYQDKGGLVNAIKDFDLTSDNRFYTLMYSYAKNAMRDYSVDNTIIRVPRNHSKSNPIDTVKVEQYTYEAEMRGMTLDEYIEHKNNLSDEPPISLRKSAVKHDYKSFDAPINEDSTNTLGDTISNHEMDVLELMGKFEALEGMNSLDARDLAIIKHYFWGDLNYRDIGDIHNLSHEQIRKYMKKALKKLRTMYKYGGNEE